MRKELLELADGQGSEGKNLSFDEMKDALYNISPLEVTFKSFGPSDNRAAMLDVENRTIFVNTDKTQRMQVSALVHEITFLDYNLAARRKRPHRLLKEKGDITLLSYAAQAKAIVVSSYFGLAPQSYKLEGLNRWLGEESRAYEHAKLQEEEFPTGKGLPERVEPVGYIFSEASRLAKLSAENVHVPKKEKGKSISDIISAANEKRARMLIEVPAQKAKSQEKGEK